MKTQPVKLKNITDKITKGTTPTTMGFNFIDFGINFIKAEALNGDSELDNKSFAYINDAAHNRLKRSILQKNDVLVTIAGVNIGKVGIVKQKHLPTNTNQAVGIVRINPDLANSNYVYYWFKNPLTFKHLQNINAQAAQPNINLEMLGNLSLLLPDIQTQKRIESAIIAYDELININRRRIHLLEESARLLFREWFVYSRFPGHEKVKIIKDGISKIPEGWGKEKVVNVVKRVAPGELYDQATAEPIGIVPILDQGQSGIIGYHNNEPSVIASLNNPVIVFANHTCNQRIIHFPFSAIQNIFPFLPSDENYRNIYWLHYATDNLVQLNAYKGHWPEFMAKNIILPPADLCDKFGNIISKIHKQLFYLSIQNQKLAQARDLLLPRLMSGKIEV